MSRDNAISFLKEIHKGMNYLEKSYDRKMLKNLMQNHMKVSKVLKKKDFFYICLFLFIEKYVISFYNNGTSSKRLK